MTGEALERYQQKRKAIIREYRLKKLKTVGLTVGIAGAFAAAVLLLGGGKLEHMPVMAAALLMDLLFTVIYLCVRLVTINHRMQTRLYRFEEEELISPFNRMK